MIAIDGAMLARIGVLGGAGSPAARLVASAAEGLLAVLGRWAGRVEEGADLGAYDLLVLPSSTGWREVRERFTGPLLVLDAALLGGGPDPAFTAHLGGRAGGLRVGDGEFLWPAALPCLEGEPLGSSPLSPVAAGAGVAYGLPLFLTPALRTVAGLRSILGALEEAVAALLGGGRFAYVEPWPHGRRAAEAICLDLDDFTTEDVLAPAWAAGRPCTVFCCAEWLPRLGARPRGVEIAAHGDVHRPFADASTNPARIEAMLAAFAAAGLSPRGFSPPYMVYSGPDSLLRDRFAYVRAGYMERDLVFLPVREGLGLRIPISYYPDHLRRYVSGEVFRDLVGRWLAWSAAGGLLAAPCFHPFVYEGSYRPFLEEERPGVWQTTLERVATWWAARSQGMERLVASGDRRELPAGAVVRCEQAAERLARLAEPGPRPAPRRSVVAGVPRRVRVGQRTVHVVLAPPGTCEVPLPASWRALGWLPRPLAARFCHRMVEVANKNGLHSCFYGPLGLRPTAGRRGRLRLPLVAPDEVVLLARRRLGRLGRTVAAIVRRLRARAGATAAPPAGAQPAVPLSPVGTEEGGGLGPRPVAAPLSRYARG